MNLSPLFSSSLVVATLLTGGAFAGEAPLVLDLSPANALEYDSSAHHGLSGDVGAPADAPEETTLLDRNGIDPDFSANAGGVAATQRISLGSRQLPEDQINIQPYVELGADVERREASPMISRPGLAADTNATLEGGTTVSVNNQIEFQLAYIRRAPIRRDSSDSERVAEDVIQTGLSIRF